MAEQEINGNDSRHLKFHGTGKGYFPVWIVNVLLTIITCGIFGAWALVRSKRYLYNNIELAGARFSYHATGGSLFVSWLLLIVLYMVFIIAAQMQNAVLAFCMFVLFVIFFPYMLVMGLRYQAMMTRLNQVRFNFRSSGLKAWWVMFGSPLLMCLAFVIILAFCFIVIKENYFSHGMMIGAGIAIFFVVLASIIQGILSWQWLRLLINGLEFGKLKFATSVSMKKCILLNLIATVIFLPFIIVVLVLMVPAYLKLLAIAIYGGMGYEEMAAMMASIKMTFLLSGLVYLLGILVSCSFLLSAFRRYVFQTLTLDGGVTLRSTATFLGCLWQIVSNLLLTVCTCFLAYPWAKIRFTRYMTENTWVEGNLDALDLQDHDEQPATDIFNRLSRGIMIF